MRESSVRLSESNSDSRSKTPSTLFLELDLLYGVYSCTFWPTPVKRAVVTRRPLPRMKAWKSIPGQYRGLKSILGQYDDESSKEPAQQSREMVIREQTVEGIFARNGSCFLASEMSNQ